jgi:multidrug transporter EmrE-like cation transporter
MTMNQLVLLGSAAVSTAVANLSLRSGITRAGGFDPLSHGLLGQAVALATQPLFVLGFLLYGGGALIWFRILSLVNVSTAYPILVSLTFLMVTIGSVAFFRESVGIEKMVGLAVILLGIGIVSHA